MLSELSLIFSNAVSMFLHQQEEYGKFKESFWGSFFLFVKKVLLVKFFLTLQGQSCSCVAEYPPKFF